MKEMVTYRLSGLTMPEFSVLKCHQAASDKGGMLLCEASVCLKNDRLICGISVKCQQGGYRLISVSEMEFHLNFDKDEPGEVYKLDAETMRPMISLSYGATRGMIAIKAQGTEMENFILPPVEFNRIWVEETEYQRVGDNTYTYRIL
ncbi:MAG: hypothetical protein LIP03_03225 [Bacteroidales bacterium]|nr:hypothetical protein [Bacteroidales bacterium]